jgi:hypothetical protein
VIHKQCFFPICRDVVHASRVHVKFAASRPQSPPHNHLEKCIVLNSHGVYV